MTPDVRTVAGSLALLAADGGCHARKDAMKSAPAPSPVSHDVQLLGKLLTLPAPPLEVTFEEVPVGTPGGLGPTDYLLIAVLRFDAAVEAKLAGTTQPSGSRDVALPSRPWFPDAVKAKLAKKLDEKSGTDSVVRGRTIDAASMFRPRYASGWAVQVDGTAYIVLVAQTS